VGLVQAPLAAARHDAIDALARACFVLAVRCSRPGQSHGSSVLGNRSPRDGEDRLHPRAELTRRGVDVDVAAVDEALNARVAHSARLLGVEPCAALVYAPDDVALWIADELAGTAPAEEAAPGVVIDLNNRPNCLNMT